MLLETNDTHTNIKKKPTRRLRLIFRWGLTLGHCDQQPSAKLARGSQLLKERGCTEGETEEKKNF